MLSRPHPHVLNHPYGYAFELWLGTDVARAVQRAPETWELRRVRRSALALHVELETSTSKLWLATACNEIVGIEWRMRDRPGDASLDAVDASLDAVSSELFRIASDIEDVHERLSCADPKRWAQVLDRLESHHDEAEHLHEKIGSVHRLPEFEDLVPEKGHSVARSSARDELPAELLAIAPREHEHFTAMARSGTSVSKLVQNPPSDARITRWERTEDWYECTFASGDDSTAAFGVPRGKRDSELPIERVAQRELHGLAARWRAALFGANERERAIAAIAEPERAYWQQCAHEELGYVAYCATVLAYAECDARRLQLGASVPDDAALRMEFPPWVRRDIAGRG
jgi:hypothetical protein